MRIAVHREDPSAEPRVAATPGEALRLAAALRATPDQPVVVAGSLYLVGAVRGILLADEEAG